METLRGWAIALLLALLGVAAFFGYGHWQRYALQRQAAAVIDESRVLFQRLAGRPDRESFHGEHESGWAALESARSYYAEGEWRPALADGRRSREILLSVLDAGRRREGEAQFIAVQGRVDYRRGERGDWEAARNRVMLRPGDYVKTSTGGSAEIMFADGTLYAARPNTLFLVNASQDGGGGAEGGEQSIELQYGWINLNTAHHGSRVATPQAEARVEDESEAVVTYDSERNQASFTTYRGAMEVAAGGERRRVETLQTLSQSDGALGAVNPLPAAPQLVEPVENHDINLDARKELMLAWEPVPGVGRYALQISRNRLFVDNVIDVDDRRTAQATLGLRGEGTFVWRVAAINEQDLRGPWSPPSRFRVASFRGAGGTGDKEPPALVLLNIQAYGSIFIVSGRTEPGASVWINGESVAVQADGSFTKTIQLAQAGWAFIEARATDAWGNESTRRARVFVESL
ncbi:MAG TPA: hypothetical protein VMT16_05180 [Thermoanaerobaculia bacterium]|nr:hypothetical protein [Thermoanaerobaculia bacterium]